MFFVNWLTDSPASDDVIDLNFILSDLVDINCSCVQRRTEDSHWKTGSITMHSQVNYPIFSPNSGNSQRA